MSKIKNGGLDEFGTGPYEQPQFGTADVEGVNSQKQANECASFQHLLLCTGLLVDLRSVVSLIERFRFFRHIYML